MFAVVDAMGVGGHALRVWRGVRGEPETLNATRQHKTEVNQNKRVLGLQSISQWVVVA